MREQRRSSDGQQLAAGRIRGRVREFRRSHGFISYQDATGRSRSIFVHYLQIQKAGWKELHAGDVVEFEIDQDSRGAHATQVEVLERAPLES